MNLDEKIIDIFMIGIGQTLPEFVRKIKQAVLEEIEKVELRKCGSKEHDDRWCLDCDRREMAFWELKDDIHKLLGDDKSK